MKEDEVIDLVKLDLCEYQAIEPLVHPFSLLREENDPVIEVSQYEALVIQDASKIGGLDSLPNPEPQQEILTEVQIPKNLKTDCVLTNPGEEVNVQDMDSWSVFTDRLRYTTPQSNEKSRLHSSPHGPPRAHMVYSWHYPLHYPAAQQPLSPGSINPLPTSSEDFTA